MTPPPGRTAQQARLIGQFVAISQYRSGQDRREGARMLEQLSHAAAAQLGPDDPVALRAELRSLEATAGAAGAAAAAAAFADLASRCKDALGGMDRVSTGARSLAAQWQRKSGDVNRGIASYLRELAWREAELGEDAHRTGIARINLSVALTERADPKDLTKARELTEQEVTFRLRPDKYGPDHAYTWVAIAAHANTLLELAERTDDDTERRQLATEAEHLAADLVVRRERRLGRRNEKVLRSLRAQARALIVLGRFEEAGWLLRRVRAVELVETELDPGRTSYYLAVALSHARRPGDLEEARGLAQEAAAKIVASTHAGSRYALLSAALVKELIGA